jgi:hypothetical protein
MNPDMSDILMMNSKFYGDYYCKKVKDFFDDGQIVTVYSHYSYRLFTIGKNKRIFRIHHTDFGTTLFTKEEWRNKKINRVLKK